MVGKKVVLMLVLLSLGLAAANFLPAQAVKTATIDFSGLGEGAIVSSLSVGAGISGDLIEGSVSVFGHNPQPENPAFAGANHAMIFDATCSGGCTGGDNDLHFPELGNGLIISKDHDSSDPNDADVDKAEFRFDFSNFGPGKVDVNSLIVADADDAVEFGEIKVYRGGPNGILVNTVLFEPTANNQKQEILINTKDIDYLVVDLGGSGMIDNIRIVVPEQPPQVNITLQGICEPQGVFSADLRLTGSLKLNGSPVANHAISLDLPGGNIASVTTDQNGNYSYLFAGARSYIGQNISAKATVNGISDTDTKTIAPDDFAGCPLPVEITLTGKCESEEQPNDLRITATLLRDGVPLPNHPISLKLPDGSTPSGNTNEEGKYSYLFIGASPNYIGQVIEAVTTVDGKAYTKQRTIIHDYFVECIRLAGLSLTGACEKKAGQSESHDLLLNGTLTDSDGFGVSNYPITLILPGRSEAVTVHTNQAGNYSYLFVGADQYIGIPVRAETILDDVELFAIYGITSAVFDECQKTRSYRCNNVFLYTSFGQPIELGSHIPSWGIEDVHVVCKGIGQGKSCRVKVKGEPGYVVKSNTLEMDVPRLLPHVKYQAQIKGYDGAWTNKGCEFSFITGGRVASISTHLSNQVDQLGWVSFGEGQSAIKPLGACSGSSDACLFAENIIGLHLDDIYGNQLPGSNLSLLQPGDRISIYRNHQLYTYEFTGSERVRQSAGGNQAILDAAEQHDLVLTTCSGYRLIEEGGSSHTRLATFTLLPRIERTVPE
jgi:hypothetical protein